MKTVDYFISLSNNSIYIKSTKEVRYQNRSFFSLTVVQEGLYKSNLYEGKGIFLFLI